MLQVLYSQTFIKINKLNSKRRIWSHICNPGLFTSEGRSLGQNIILNRVSGVITNTRFLLCSLLAVVSPRYLMCMAVVYSLKLY